MTGWAVPILSSASAQTPLFRMGFVGVLCCAFGLASLAGSNYSAK
jgi:hypothetical protein